MLPQNKINTAANHIDIAAQCFFNAFLRQYSRWKINTSAKHINIALPSINQSLIINYQHISLVGPHSFLFPCELVTKNNIKKIAFKETVLLLTSLPEISKNLPSNLITLFNERVINSHNITQNTIKKRISTVKTIFTPPLSFIQAEQAVIAGHAMHPAPKFRTAFINKNTYNKNNELIRNNDEKFAPESNESFSLQWFALDPQYIESDAIGHSTQEMVNTIIDDLQLRFDCYPTHFLLLPMHPWQASTLLNNSTIKTLLAKGKLQNLGLNGAGWRATTSIRAIYHPQCQFMLKFSLSLKLTNSIRHLSLKEVKRGILLEKILKTNPINEWLQRYPTTTVISEPGYMAIKQGNNVLEESIVSFRVNPFFNNEKRETLVLASLTQANPLGGDNLVSAMVRQQATLEKICIQATAEKWFSLFLSKVIEPLIAVRSNYGLIFLAHQQNILVDIKRGFPVGLMYRDCQGTGFTDVALDAFSDVLKDLPPENYMPHKYVDPYISYYLIFNSTFGLISALSAQLKINENIFLNHMTLFIAKLAKQSWQDSTLIDYLLTSSSLIYKDNFNVYLSNVNESSITDPSTIYKKIPNPLQSLNPPDIVKHLTNEQLIGFYYVKNNSQHLNIFTSQGQQSLLLKRETNYITIEKIQCLLTPFNLMQILSVIEHILNNYAQDKVKIDASLWKNLCKSDYPLTTLQQTNDLIFTQKHLEQIPSLWLHEEQVHNKPHSNAIANNLVEQSQLLNKTIIYRRYFYEVEQELTFNLVSPQQDLHLFHDWMNQKRIAKFWELDKPINELEQYLQKSLTLPHQFPIIASFNGIPFAYFEIYWAQEDRIAPYYNVSTYDRGIHLLIGNPAYLGEKYWRLWGQALSHYCFIAEHQTTNIVGEPRIDNKSIVKLWKHFGFKKLKEFDFPHKRASLVVMNRATFFGEIKSLGQQSSKQTEGQ